MAHEYALRGRAQKDNKHMEMELELKRQAMKPVVLFDRNEFDLDFPDLDDNIDNSIKPKAKFKRNTKQSELEPPEVRIVPIPIFNLDDDDEKPTPTPITEPKKPPKRNTFGRLHLPLVFHGLKSDCFKGKMKNRSVSDKLKSKRRIKETTTPENGTDLADMISGLKITAGTNPPSLLQKNNSDLLDAYIDKLIFSTKKQESESTPRTPFTSSTPSGNGNYCLPSGSIRKPTAGIFEIESDPWTRHADFFKLATKMDALDIEAALEMKKTKSVEDSSCTNTAIRIASALNLKDVAELDQFQIYNRASIYKSLKHYSCSNMSPDAMKHFAFAYWQRGELDKCVYSLSEAHGSYLRTDILDKHNQYFGRPDEHVSTSINPDSNLEKIKLEKFRQQSNDLTTPGKGLSLFSEHLDKLDPDWNIIQLTSMFHVHNRFSTSGTAGTQTPALFLTCFSNLPGAKKRDFFTTYIREPVAVPGVSNVGILSEFKKVMLENRIINEKYVGDRKKYWEVREEHNSAVRNVLKAVQENWLSPWYFLLPGNVTNLEIQKKIYNFVLSVELALNKKFTSYQKVAFYKLVENYSFLCPNLKDLLLLDLVSFILEVPQKRVQKITLKLIEIGSTIREDAQRHPTILIIDQGIEQLPWEWLKCLRTTTVTRVQSISIMYSLMNMVKTIPPVDPAQAVFVLNPDGSLKNVQTRLKKYFNSRTTWKGHVGKKPSPKDIDSALQSESLFLYCGHGSGQFMFPEHLLQKIYCRAIPMLMGCGSAQYKCWGPKAEATSIINSYFIAACPSVVGFLYEVTDVECDRITVELLEHWTPGKGPIPAMASFDSVSIRPQVNCLATAVRLSRKGATQFLTQAGIVNYGLPIQKADNADLRSQFTA